MYPYFPRSSHHWGFFRELTVQAPFPPESLPDMRVVGDRGDYSFVLVGRFEVVALNKKISVHSNGVYRTSSVSDPHLVSVVSVWGFLFDTFVVYNVHGILLILFRKLFILCMTLLVV